MNEQLHWTMWTSLLGMMLMLTVNILLRNTYPLSFTTASISHNCPPSAMTQHKFILNCTVLLTYM